MEDRKKLEPKSGPTLIRKTSWEYEKTMVMTNESNIETLLATCLPDVYMIWQTLSLYKMNGEFLPSVIKAVGDIASSTKLGEVIIEIRPDNETLEAVIKRIRAVDTKQLDMCVSKK